MGKVYLVRHAAAGARGSHTGPDRERALIEKGVEQAKKMGAYLADKEISEIYSSPYTRCIETAAHIAEACGLEVVEEPRLGEGNWLELPITPENVVWVAHGDNIPELVSRLGFPCHQCQKGSAWRLTTDDSNGSVLNAVYIPKNP